MKKLNLGLMIILVFNLASCGQLKNASIQKKENSIDGKMLMGKWRSESDAEYILVFEKEKYIELYGKDTTDNMKYKLSSSCNLIDSSFEINLQKAFLLFYLNDNSVSQCNEILNLKSDVLSWMNNINGKIFVFRKVK